MVDPLRLAVGEVYDSGVKRWPGKELVLTTEGCVVLIACVSASAHQIIRQFQTADIEFAWIDCPHNGFLCCRFGDLRWEFLPFNPHRDTPHGISPGVPTVPGEHLPVAVGLAEIDGPVLATRTVTWPEDFAAAVAATVARLAGQSFDSDAARDEVNFLYVFEGAERLSQRAKVRSVCAWPPGA